MSNNINVEVTSTEKKSRIYAHSHIQGLGLKQDGTANDNGGGLVGQQQAREAAGIVVELIKAKKMAGKALLFAGPTGSGKTVFLISLILGFSERN